MPATTPSSRPSPTGSSAADVTSADTAAVDALTYEQARDELVSVVARLEAGGETLEGSLALWERGEALAARCQQWLDGARARLDAARAVTPTSEARGTTTGEPDAAAAGSADGPDDLDEDI